MFWTTIQGAGRSDNLSIGELRYYDNQDVLAYVRAERKGSGSGARVKLNLSYHFTDEWVRRYNCATDGTGAVEDRAACITHNLSTLEKMRNNRDRVHTPGFFTTWEGHFWHQRLRMVLGADGYFDMISSSRRDSKRDDVWAWQDKDRGNFSEGSQYLTLGGFLMGDVDVLRLGPSTIAINGGIRLSYFEAFAPDVPVLGNVRYQHVGAVGSAGLAYLFKDLLNVYADFSQGFRAPNLQESTVLGNTGTFFEVPADSLVPQTSDTVEVGVKLKTRYLRVTVAGFASWLDDAFAREEVPMSDWDEYGISSNDVGDQAVMKRVNAASAFYRGVESSLAVGPFAGVSLWGNGAVVIGDVTDQKGNEAPGRRVPPVSGAAGVRWELQRIRLFAEFFVKWALAQDRLSSGDRQDLRICEDKSSPGQFLDNCAGTSGWVTLNLRAGYVPLDWLQLNLSIENLADTRYKYHGSGIYSPGINALAGLTLTY